MVIGCKYDSFESLVHHPDHGWLHQLPLQELDRLRSIFYRSHLLNVVEDRQFDNLNFFEQFEDAIFVPMYLVESNFWTAPTGELNFVILNLRFTKMQLDDCVKTGQFWHFNRHIACYNFATADGASSTSTASLPRTLFASMSLTG